MLLFSMYVVEVLYIFIPSPCFNYDVRETDWNQTRLEVGGLNVVCVHN
jgi:hypothetical protein